jgi:ribosome maturation factor RimP
MAERGRRPTTGARSTARPGSNRANAGRSGAARTGPASGAVAGPGVDLAALRIRLRSIVEPMVGRAGFDLEDLTVSRAGRRHVLRITVDADGGVGYDELGDLSRAISAGLDAAESGGDGPHRDGQGGGELIAGSYTLEVSSPGVDRPLTLPRHWRRNVGRLVRVSVGGATLTGRVTAADDAEVTFTVDGQTRTVAHGDLGPGRVQVEFNRPGGGDWELSGDDGDPELSGEEDGS